MKNDNLINFFLTNFDKLYLIKYKKITILLFYFG